MDQARIDRAVDACYEAVVAPEAWRSALDDMSEAMGAAAIMFYPKNLTLDSAPVPCSQEYDAFLPDFIAGGWYQGHYRADRGWPLLQQGKSVVVIEHELATDEERKMLPHYNELYLAKGYPGFAAIGFEAGSEQWAMCILRNHSQGFFTPDDAAKMAPLAAHFRRMVRLAEKFETQCVSTSLSALDEQRRPAAILAKNGCICAMNHCCETLMSDPANGFALRGGRLSANLDESNRKLQKLVHAVTSAGHDYRRAAHTETVAVQRETRLPVLVEAVSMAVLGLEHTLHANAMLIFYDPEQKPASKEDAYRKLFGLTPAEAKLASRLARGDSLERVAEVNSFSKETVRSQLKSVFAKTSTHRQGELVSLLTRVTR